MYRNCCYQINPLTKEGEIILFTWDKDGNPIKEIHPHKSYLYYEDRKGTFESIYGSFLVKKEFSNSYERRKWTDNYKDMKIFECLPPVREFLIDYYEGQQETDEFRQFPLRIHFCDIEISVGTEFPNPSEAKYPINAISIFDSYLNKFFVWTLSNHNTEEFSKKIKESYSKENNLLWKLEDVTFFNFNCETDLLLSFLNWFQNNYPDVISGWNVAKFDIPYIVNRLKNFFGEKHLNLSPVNKVFAKKMKMKNAETERDSFVIEGISIIDYLEIYKYKFPPKNKPPSFKLDAVAEAELKYKKLEYDGTIRNFYKNDFYRFILYNIQDTYLVYKLDEKLKFINLTRIICNIGLTEYETILKSSPYIFGALVLEARKLGKKIISNNVDIAGGNDSYEGAYVFPVQAGKYTKGVSSLDFNSLYPNIMITLNISPETKLGKIIEMPSELQPDYVIKLKTAQNVKKLHNLDIFKDKVVISANKVLYINPTLKKGLVPIFLERMQTRRVEAKKKMLEYEDKLQKLKKVKNPNAEVKNAIDKLASQVTIYHHFQNAFKVFSNSLYGQMGSPYFPLFDVDNAEAITISGQYLIKEMAKKLNSEIGKYNTSHDTNNEYILAGDTDSVAPDGVIKTNLGNLTIEELYNKFNNNENELILGEYGHEILNVNGKVQSLYFDTNTKSIKMGNIKHLIRHKVTKKKYKVVIGNKEVIITEDHSLIINRFQKYVEVKPTDVKKKDFGIININKRVHEVPITSSECIGEFENEYVYDIEMDNEFHNFFANDILVHNSLYFNCEVIVKHVLGNTNLDNSEDIKKVCTFLDKEFVPVINEYCYEVVKRDFFSPIKRVEFKRETLCKSAYIIAKKHYVLHIVNDEGVDVDKFKYTGVDVKKTELPNSIKDVLKYVIEGSLKNTWDSQHFREYIVETWNKFKNMSLDEIAFWKGYNTEKELDGFFEHEKGAGPHAKAAIYYNTLLKKLNIADKHDEIRVGDRLRYVFINKNNPFGINVIAWKDKYPEEFKSLFEVDYGTMFKKVVLAPLDSFVEINKWSHIDPSAQAEVNILDL